MNHKRYTSSENRPTGSRLGKTEDGNTSQHTELSEYCPTPQTFPCGSAPRRGPAAPGCQLNPTYGARVALYTFIIDFPLLLQFCTCICPREAPL